MKFFKTIPKLPHTYMYIANSIYLRFTHIHVHTYIHVHVRTYMHTLCTCTCTYMYICTLYIKIVHCTRTFFTFIPILNKHKNYHQNLKLRKVLFIKKFHKGEHKKATTHHTVKTHVSILSIQTCPPLSVLCQKNPYTSD